MRIAGCIHAVPADSDGEISLQEHSFFVGVLDRLGELLIEMELHPAVEVRVVAVPAGAEFCIRVQPVGVFFNEALAGGGRQVFAAAARISLEQILVLKCDNPRIVYRREGVQFLPESLVGGIFFYAHIGKMDVDRMQGEGRNRAVGIGVRPLSVAGGIVDGKKLKDALSGALHPIYETGNVVEFSHPETLLAA